MPLNRWEIKSRLDHGAITAIAKRLRVSVSLVSAVLSGRRRNEMVERAIASRAGVPVELAFPRRDAA